MSFIIENTIVFSAVEWGIIDPIDKSTLIIKLIYVCCDNCDNLKVGHPWDKKWFHKFHNAVSNREPSCMYLLVPRTEHHLSSFKRGFLNIFSWQNLLCSLSRLLFLLLWNKYSAKNV